MQVTDDMVTTREQRQELLQLVEPVVIVGLGKTGLSVARFLLARDIRFSVVDSRATPPGLEELKAMLPAKNIVTGEFSPALFSSAMTLIVSPGISVHEPLIAAARDRGASIIGDIELFARIANAPVVAITGSNGKSTVTTLFAEMAHQANRQVRVGGNLGVPALDLLDDEAELYVLELSSFQLETTDSLDAVVSVILNISEDHMDRYDSLLDYAAAKARIYKGHGTVVANLDDEMVMRLVDELGMQRNRISFSMRLPFEENYGLCPHQGETWLCRGQELLISVNKLGIKGTHNMANALAALAMGEAIQLPMQAMLAALQTYTGLPHRTQWVAECHGVNWFNDSKATNVGAAVAAIAGVPGKQVILLAGGQGKGQDFAPLAVALHERVKAVVLFGEDAAQIEAIIPAGITILHARDMSEAVRLAAGAAEEGDAVLLSPACASFDMFNNYEHRGEVFMQTVREYCA